MPEEIKIEAKHLPPDNKADRYGRSAAALLKCSTELTAQATIEPLDTYLLQLSLDLTTTARKILEAANS